MDYIHHILVRTVEIAVLFFELIGIFLIIFAGLRSVYDLIKDRKMRHRWMETLILALSFLLMAEMLESIFIKETKDLIVLAGIFILRALMVVLMHWEMNHE